MIARALVAVLLTAACAADARTLPPPAEPAPTFDPRAYLGQGDRYSCRDFEAQWMAQRVLRLDATDPNRLDADGDGVACASLRGPRDVFPVRR